MGEEASREERDGVIEFVEIDLSLSFLDGIERLAHQKKDKEEENAMVSLVCIGFVCL